MQTLTQRRSVPVDAAKTAAIFGTLLIHASAAGGFAGAPGSFGWTSALFWNCLLRSAVPVFFLCSGALHKASEQDLARLVGDYDLAGVIDFRTQLERDKEPDPRELMELSLIHI